MRNRPTHIQYPVKHHKTPARLYNNLIFRKEFRIVWLNTLLPKKMLLEKGALDLRLNPDFSSILHFDI